MSFLLIRIKQKELATNKRWVQKGGTSNTKTKINIKHMTERIGNLGAIYRYYGLMGPLTSFQYHTSPFALNLHLCPVMIVLH